MGVGMKLAPFLAAAALASCAHQVSLIPRGDGPIGKGSAAASMGDSGKLSVDLGGKAYSGEWIFVRDGGTVGAAFGSAWSGGNSVSGNSTFFGTSTAGNGRAILTASDGSRIRCVFRYNEMGGTGVGECQDDQDRLYDMFIK